MPAITKQELQKHTSHNDVWFSIHGKVYNVTKFLDEHPGGEEVLMEQAGQDATDAFEDIGHSEDSRVLLKKFYVGDLVKAGDASPSSSKKTYAAAAAVGSPQAGETKKNKESTVEA